MGAPSKRPAALFAAALVALAALVWSGALTGLDNGAIHHLMPWPEPATNGLLNVRAAFVPQTRSTLGGTLVSLWTYPASPFVSLLVVGACALVLRRHGRVRAGVALLAIWLVVNAVELLGKLAVDRPGIDVANFRESFPSGHSARAVVVAAAVWWTWRRAGPVALAWALAVPFALVAIGDHVPTDVVGGVLLAACAVAALRTAP